MKTILLFLLLSIFSILPFLSSAKAGNIVLPRSKANVPSYGAITLDSKDDRKMTLDQLKNEEDDEDEDDEDEDDDNDDEEEE